MLINSKQPISLVSGQKLKNLGPEPLSIYVTPDSTDVILTLPKGGFYFLTSDVTLGVYSKNANVSVIDNIGNSAPVALAFDGSVVDIPYNEVAEISVVAGQKITNLNSLPLSVLSPVDDSVIDIVDADYYPLVDMVIRLIYNTSKEGRGRVSLVSGINSSTSSGGGGSSTGTVKSVNSIIPDDVGNVAMTGSSIPVSDTDPTTQANMMATQNALIGANTSAIAAALGQIGIQDSLVLGKNNAGGIAAGTSPIVFSNLDTNLPLNGKIILDIDPSNQLVAIDLTGITGEATITGTISGNFVHSNGNETTLFPRVLDSAGGVLFTCPSQSIVATNNNDAHRIYDFKLSLAGGVIHKIKFDKTSNLGNISASSIRLTLTGAVIEVIPVANKLVDTSVSNDGLGNFDVLEWGKSLVVAIQAGDISKVGTYRFTDTDMPTIGQAEPLPCLNYPPNTGLPFATQQEDTFNKVSIEVSADTFGGITLVWRERLTNTGEANQFIASCRENNTALIWKGFVYA